MTQLTFPVKAQSQREEKFLEFHAKHPEVYAALSRFAHQCRDFYIPLLSCHNLVDTLQTDE